MSTTPTTAVSWLQRWPDVPAEEPADGIERRMVWGRRLMICRLRFAPHVVAAVHTHPHEQFTLVERGRVRFEVDGEQGIASAGAVLHFPSNVPHGATMLDEEVVLVDIFSPVRDDFLEDGSGGRGEV
ncbi:MAG TPA: cupin domain-containing protein [Vicinamibacterales bacterium]|nr:cupin domain-containing protein [Acidobacteriota bacterium]HOC18685.1 cupin domain-containing protein [Vicinamibacterales bacterium]